MKLLGASIVASVCATIAIAGCSGNSGLEDKTFDVGAVFPDITPQLRHSFAVKNDANQPIKIREIFKSCTCTSAGTGKTTLAPGESTDLNLVVDTRPIFNNWALSCRVVTDHPAEPERTYKLSYRTYPRVRFDIDAIQIDDVTAARTVAEGQPARKAWLEIYEPVGATGQDALSDLKAPPPVVVSFDRKPEVTLLEKGTVRRLRYALSVSVAPETVARSGTRVENVIATTKLGYRASTSATWTVDLPLSVSPSTISFGVIGADDEVPIRKILIKSNDGRLFRLLARDAEAGDIEVRGVPSSGPANQHVVQLAFHGPRSGRAFITGKVLVTTDHPETRNIEVAWSAIVKGALTPASGPAMPGKDGL
jgi:hypothetical protein